MNTRNLLSCLLVYTIGFIPCSQKGLAQEVFIKVVDVSQLMADAEYILGYDDGISAYVATKKSKKVTASTDNSLGFASLSAKIVKGKLLLDDNKSNVLRFHLKGATARDKSFCFHLKTEKNMFLRDHQKSLVLEKDSSGTSLFRYGVIDKTPYVYRAENTKRHLFFNWTGRIFGLKEEAKPNASSPKDKLPCLYVRKNTPSAYVTKGDGKNIILYDSDREVVLGKGKDFTVAVKNLPQTRGTIYANRRKDLKVFQIEKEGENIFLRDDQGKYLGINGKELVYTERSPNNNCAWYIERLGEAYILKNRETQQVVRYSSQGFVADENTKKSVTILFQEKVRSLFMNSIGYATYFTDAAYIMPEGLQGSSIKGNLDGNNTQLVTPYEYNAGDVVPPHTPLLIKQYLPGEFTLYPLLPTTEEGKENPSENLLRGQLSKGMITTESNQNLYYKLTYNEDRTRFGFFWGEEGGSPFALQNDNRAYLVLPKQAVTPSPGFYFDGDIMVGLPSVKTQPVTPVSSLSYDLLGRQTKRPSKGVYIINSQKVLK